MLSNFIYAKTKALFVKELNANNVPEEAIVFIEDTGEIWNHGMYFSKSQVHIGSEAPEDDSNIKIWLIPDGETESEDPIIIIDSQLSTISTNPVENQAITKALNSKQDTLVSGVNIKKINGVDILGEGEVTIQTGTDITVDSQMDDSSTNPVQNKIVKAAIDDAIAIAKEDFKILYIQDTLTEFDIDFLHDTPDPELLPFVQNIYTALESSYTGNKLFTVQFGHRNFEIFNIVLDNGCYYGYFINSDTGNKYCLSASPNNQAGLKLDSNVYGKILFLESTQPFDYVISKIAEDGYYTINPSTDIFEFIYNGLLNDKRPIFVKFAGRVFTISDIKVSGANSEICVYEPENVRMLKFYNENGELRVTSVKNTYTIEEFNSELNEFRTEINTIIGDIKNALIEINGEEV